MNAWEVAWRLTFWTWMVLPSANSLDCGRCDREANQLTCPSELSSDRYEITLRDVREWPRSSFHLKCKHDAQSVDFSYISDCDFSTVKYVELHWCPMPNSSFSEMFEHIGIIAKNVTSLDFVNLGQRYENLQEWHLEGLTNLEVLKFKDNGFTSIPPHVFDNTPKLSHLMLVDNPLKTLPESLFHNTKNLTRLELQNNGIVSLPKGLFANLTHLRNISLWENRLSQFQPELLSDSPKLWSLELTKNHISQLDPDVFSGLRDIKKILISNNKLKTFPERVFHECPNLERLEFDNNRITDLPDDIFSENVNIKRLNMDNNRLTRLPKKLFTKMKNLENLKMKRNRMKSVPLGLFEGLEKLQVLELQSNILEDLPPGIFDDLISVNLLILQNNSLRELPDKIFANCKSLTQLYLSLNKLNTLLPTMFPNSSLESVIDLSNNNLSFSSSRTELTHYNETITVQDYFPLARMRGLTRLLLKNNQITEMPLALTTEFENLSVLDLSYNSISYLDHHDLTFKSSRLKIDYRHNNIKVINLNYMNFSTDTSSRVEIYVSENPLVCNCELYKFAELTQGMLRDDTALTVADASQVQCSYPEMTYVTFIDPTSLTCKSQKCIENCTCMKRAHDKMFVVDCSSQNLQSIPLLKKEHIPKDDDYGVTLILTNNSITSLDGLGKGEYTNLVNLTIPYNKLSFINETHLPKTLEALNVRGNIISSLTTSVMKFFNLSDVQLNLGNNPWRCDCNTLELYKFLADSDHKVLDIHEVGCSDFKDEGLINLTEEDLCPLIKQPYVIASITVAIIFLVVTAILLGTVGFYKFKEDIKIWLYIHRLLLWAVTEEEKDGDRK